MSSSAGSRQRRLSVFDGSRSEEMLNPGASSPRVRLLEMVSAMLLKNSVTRPVSVDDQLSAAGLTSLDMVNLMIALEAEFDVTIPGSEITPANFRSIVTIEKLILRIGRPG